MGIKLSKNTTNALLIIFGTFIMSIGINFFLLPNKITTGGATGVATIFFYKFNIDMGLAIFAINIPLYIIAIRKFGLKFCFKSIVATMLFTIFIEIVNFQNYVQTHDIEPFLSAIYGGILIGLGISFVFKAGASTGGTDLLAQILQKKESHLNLSKLILYIDLVIIIGLIIVFGDLNLGLYSAIAIYFSTKTIETVFEGVNYTKVINIITKNDDAITNSIIKELERGATVTKCIGAYTKNEIINITCIVSLNEIAKVKKIAYSIDPNAFIYITNAIEVWGEGFKRF